MYEELLQSDARPFRATPDRQFYFPSEAIESARQTALRATLRAEGPVLILGGAGLGKSLLAQILADDLSTRFDIVNLHAAQLCSRKALLQSILFELNMPYRDLSEGELRLSILDRLVPSPETAPDGVLIIVDEAHTLPVKLLDEIRLITNFSRNGQPRARVVLLGSLKLEDVFAQPKLDSFNQRLAARCYLQPLSRSETRDFVRHQLSIAGIVVDQGITDEALDTVFTACDGLPRLTNQLMDHAVVLAGTKNATCISTQIIEEAWADLQQLPAPWHAGEEARDWNTAPTTTVEFGSLPSQNLEVTDPAVPDSILPAAASAAEFDQDDQPSTTSVFEFGPSSAATTTALETLAADSSDASHTSDETLPFGQASSYGEASGSGEAVTEPSETSCETTNVEACSTSTPGDAQQTQLPPDIDEVKPAVTFEQEVEQQVNTSSNPNFFAAFSPESEGSIAQPVPEENGLAVEHEPTKTESVTTAIPMASIQSEVETAADGGNFFAGRPTDDQMLAFAEEAAQLETVTPTLKANGIAALNVSEAIEAMNIDSAQVFSYYEGDLSDADNAAVETIDTDVPCTASLHNSIANIGDLTTASAQPLENDEPVEQHIGFSSQQVVSSGSADLFGNDFEEEFAIDTEGLQKVTMPGDTFTPASTQAPGRSTNSATVTEQTTAVHSQDLSAIESQEEAPQQIEVIIQENSPQASQLTGLPIPQEETQDLAETVLEAPEPVEFPQNVDGMETEFGDAAGNSPWSVDVMSTDVQNEQRLHNEIEDIVSQLNFSAFAVESESMEQVAEIAPLNSESSTQPPEDSIRRGDNDDVYMLHRPIESDVEGNIFTQVAEYDDDRDLLVIEEDIPLTEPAPPRSDNEPPKKTVAYSQLFAKLRK